MVLNANNSVCICTDIIFVKFPGYTSIQWQALYPCSAYFNRDQMPKTRTKSDFTRFYSHSMLL